MLLFRSEDHLDAWLAGRPSGATIPITKLAELAEAWWGDPDERAEGPDHFVIV